MNRPQLLVFDVNETLLDLGSLRSSFVDAFGSSDHLGEWFVRMLHGSVVANAIGQYRSFTQIGAEALLVVAERVGVSMSAEDALDVVGRMKTAPPHPDVTGGLQRLFDGGVRMMALTNGSAETAEAQMANSGLARFFEAIMSADAVRRFKPAPEVYLMAGASRDVGIDQMMMVASHDWDLAGARSVGMKTAFVARPGAVWSPGYSQPDIVVPTIGELADVILTLPEA